jgi:hypothetical protein
MLLRRLTNSHVGWKKLTGSGDLTRRGGRQTDALPFFGARKRVLVARLAGGCRSIRPSSSSDQGISSAERGGMRDARAKPNAAPVGVRDAARVALTCGLALRLVRRARERAREALACSPQIRQHAPLKATGKNESATYSSHRNTYFAAASTNMCEAWGWMWLTMHRTHADVLDGARRSAVERQLGVGTLAQVPPHNGLVTLPEDRLVASDRTGLGATPEFFIFILYKRALVGCALVVTPAIRFQRTALPEMETGRVRVATAGAVLAVGALSQRARRHRAAALDVAGAGEWLCRCGGRRLRRCGGGLRGNKRGLGLARGRGRFRFGQRSLLESTPGNICLSNW